MSKLTSLQKSVAISIAFSALNFAAMGALARPVELNIEMQNFSGPAAYMIVYLTDKNGRVRETLYKSGKKSKYYSHLKDWRHGRGRAVDGITGASIKSGQSLIKTVTIADKFFDSDYQIRIDTAVEDYAEVGSDISAPLSRDVINSVISGKSHIKTLTLK